MLPEAQDSNLLLRLARFAHLVALGAVVEAGEKGARLGRDDGMIHTIAGEFLHRLP